MNGAVPSRTVEEKSWDWPTSIVLEVGNIVTVGGLLTIADELAEVAEIPTLSKILRWM